MDSYNENISLGACKLLLNKVLPDVKAVAIGDFPQPVKTPVIEEEMSTEELVARTKEAIQAIEESRIGNPPNLLEKKYGELNS